MLTLNKQTGLYELKEMCMDDIDTVCGRGKLNLGCGDIQLLKKNINLFLVWCFKYAVDSCKLAY